MSRKQESGQVFVLAALSMMVLIGIAAFCVNASYFYYQHQRMQSQVDEQTRLASGSGCTSTWPNGTRFDGGTLVISPTTFFTQTGSYCDGVLTKSPGGLFGNILRFPNKINVHAVAEHGGTTEIPFTFLGLDPAPGCSVSFGGNSNITVFSNVLSNSNGDPCVTGSATLTTPNGSYVANANMSDPYRVTINTSVKGQVSPQSCNTPSGCVFPCTGSYKVPNGATYYQPLSASSVALPGSLQLQSNDKLYFLPYCSGSTAYPGVYMTDKLKDSGGELHTITSTMVLSTTNLDVSGSSIVDLNSPDVPNDWYLKGYALYELTPCTPQGTGTSESLNGGSTYYINGLIDLSCMNVTINGGSNSTWKASVVAWTVTFKGGGSGTNIQRPDSTPPRGAFLVQ